MENTKKNYFTVRLSDTNTLSSIEELLATKLYASGNILLNRAVEIGISEIYAKVFARNGTVSAAQAGNGTGPQPAGDLERMVKQNILTLDDVFVILNILEYMTSTLYNIELAKINNLPVSDDMVRSGVFSDLPDNLQAVKNELMARLNKRGEK